MSLLTNREVKLPICTRWIREGFIPFFGAHELLPQDRMRLAGTDSKVIGFASKMKLPLNGNIRRNTCKLLNLLGLGTIQLPPVHLMAEKIIKDLQMPCKSYIFLVFKFIVVYLPCYWFRLCS